MFLGERNGIADVVEMSMSAEIRPYRISVGDDVLDDLKSRLRNTRWPEAELVDDWSQGAPLKWIKDVCRTWAEDYDWRAAASSGDLPGQANGSRCAALC